MARHRKSEGEQPVVSPIDFDPPSNGEFCPRPPPARAERADRMWRQIVEATHRRVGMTRREFAESAGGMAAALWVINQLSGCGSETGAGAAGRPASSHDASSDAGYDVTPDMFEDGARARERLTGDEFIVDVQTHASMPLTPWPDKAPPERALDYMHQIFVQSDTAVACISGVPAARDLGAANVEARTQLRAIIERLAGPRLLLHANADPELGAAELDYMAAVASAHAPAAFKVYPHRGPKRLDSDDLGLPFIEQARAVGVRAIAAHRGISGGGGYDVAGSPLDVVRAAKAFPDVNFLIYHSGWEPGGNEDHPFVAGAGVTGVDRLIQALIDNDIGPDGNVYAELGTTWMNLINAPGSAAHVLGKLLTRLGPNRILWGTDSVFNGVPQGQIVAFRSFVIPEAMQQAYGYPALTAEARRQIFGLNAARLHGIDPAATRYIIAADDVERLKTAYRDDPRAAPAPDRREYEGPRTRRQFLALAAQEQEDAQHTGAGHRLSRG